MEKAQKFIFMEYHAIEDAEAWHKIQDVLEERVKAGVKVRVFYEDMGSIGFINTDLVKKMEAIGIHCREMCIRDRAILMCMSPEVIPSSSFSIPSNAISII